MTAVASHHSRRSDPKEKAKLLNNQVSSVFPKEDGSALHDLGPSSVPDMPTISTRQKGIRKLLLRLNLHKAKGPDELPTRLLKEMVNEIIPAIHCLPGLITARQNSNRLEYIRSYSHANFQEGRQKKTFQLPPSGFNISLLQGLGTRYRVCTAPSCGYLINTTFCLICSMNSANNDPVNHN